MEREPFVVAGFSGGKDSTAMVLAMQERGERLDALFTTPTGDELPELWAHWQDIADRVGVPVVTPQAPTLAEVIESQKMLPNHRARFCTRMIKIAPAVAWVARKTLEGFDVTMCVGLRADEEERKGIIDARINTRFPLREYGMGLAGVHGFLRERGIKVPKRTDCARCPYQKLGEWWDLWKEHPEIYEDAVEDEIRHGHTYRSDGRDTWPASLAELRAEFERGRTPKSVEQRRQLPLFQGEEIEACRVCRL